ncbi:MAG TPA: SDR family oxidoreductase [Planctomycetota bacterium]
MDLGIRDRVALVLGASKGMGRACAEALGREGCRLAVVARDVRGLDEAWPGGGVLKLAGDATSDADRQRIVAETAAAYGRIDILLNNCGGPKPGGFGAPLTAADWAEGVERALLQVVKWTEAAVPHMKGWGRVVNIVSTTVKQSNDDLLISDSVRPGVIGYAKAASRALAPKGITINSILPGLIRTDRAMELAEIRAKKENISIDDALRARSAEIPAGRLGEPEEVGELAAFLCSAAYITGTSIVIDGGLTRAL